MLHILLTVTVVAFMLLNKNKIGEQIFSPIVSRDNGKNKSDGGGLLLEGNPISSFKIEAEARESVLDKWFHILGSLTDVSYVHFRTCDLGGNRLHMLGEALRNLAHLSVLYLTHNQISSLLPLKEVFEKHTGLRLLKLQDNFITSISGLETATGLTNLDLYSNQITDISGLAKLTRLTYLSLYENKIMSVLPLKNLTGLTTLYLHHNQITNISVLAKLTGLTTLYLHHNQITNISVLAKLTRLTKLWLNDNKIISVLPLTNLTGLFELDLFNNKITSVLPLQSLYSMKYLDLGSNQIKKFLPLQSLTNLRSLGIYNNPFNKTDINALRKKLPNVVFKNCSATGRSGKVYSVECYM
jgi:Leucine-rich repeat (LRR) protein